MNERLLTLAGGALALVAMILLLAPRPDPASAELSRPTSEDRGADGLAALRLWLNEVGVPVTSLREPYEALSLDPELPQQGNLLITSLPFRVGGDCTDYAQLDAWLRRGNAILVLGAFADQPSWARYGSHDFSLLRALGVERAMGATEVEAADNPVMPQQLRPTHAHPLLQGVGQIRADWHRSEHPHWRLEPTDGPRSFPVLLTDAGQWPALWQIRVGEGRAWVSSYAGILANGTLGEGDNARLAMNLVNTALGPGGRVLFDDYRHGLTVLYDPRAFFGDPRLHATLGFLGALWLIYLLGHSNRLAPLRATVKAPSQAAEVAAVGNFFARRMTPAAAARQLLNHFHNDIRNALHLPHNGEPVWEPLRRNARIDAGQLAALQRLSRQAEANRSVDLRQLVTVMQQIKETLS